MNFGIVDAKDAKALVDANRKEQEDRQFKLALKIVRNVINEAIEDNEYRATADIGRDSMEKMIEYLTSLGYKAYQKRLSGRCYDKDYLIIEW